MTILKKILLALASAFFTLLLFEFISRCFILPSDECAGTFFGRKLPPEIVNVHDKPRDFSRQYRKLVVNGKKITVGDLWGIKRVDEILGYAPMESAMSVNGWWQSNSLGALRRSEVSKEIIPNTKRFLVFGDSFTQCSQVPIEESWPFYLGKINKNIEVINFGVEGYGMCQAYLRYKAVKNKINYDVVLLVFVPSADLWRDINVCRSLRGWRSSILTPRFVLEGDNLRLILSPCKKRKDFYEDSQRGLSDKFKEYLYAYDRFYFKSKYETIPIIGDSILYKLLARQNYIRKEETLDNNLMDHDSEAVEVSKKIFEEMSKEVQESGGEFVLLILPKQDDVEWYKNSIEYKRKWGKMVSVVTGIGIKYIDLMKDFIDIPVSQIDHGYDGTHYGPRTNRLIAELLSKKLDVLNLRREE